MKILLTSAGFANKNIGNKFLELLDKPVSDTKVLFVPTAAINKGAKFYVDKCKEELLKLGIKEANIFIYDFEYKMTEDKALTYDVIYFTGGETSHLLSCIRNNKFDSIIDTMMSNNKVYVGVSAGSIIMTPNILLDDIHNPKTKGLGYLQAYISVHCNEYDEERFKDIQKKLPLPYISLSDNQAVMLDENGYKVVE